MNDPRTDLVELSYAVRPIEYLPRPGKTVITPFDYQIAAAQQVGYRKMPYMAHRPGAGKTGIALAAMANIDSRDAVLVICPPSIVGQWAANGMRWLGLPFTALTTGEQVRTVLSDPSTVLPARYIVPDSLLHEIPRTAHFTMTVWDEVHRGKTRDARRTRAFFGYADDDGVAARSDTVIGMSGTPMPNSPVELWPYVQSAAKHIAPNFAAYCARYCPPVIVNSGGHERVTYPRVTNGMELRNLLRGSFLIRPKPEDIDNQLPPLREEEVDIKVNVSAGLQWDRIMAVLDGSIATDEEKESISRARRELGVAKAIRSIGYLSDIIDGGSAPLIWCWHREVAETIAAELLIPCIHGGISIPDRTQRISEFIEGKHSAIVATIGSMGVGVDGLQHRTDLAIYVERSSVPMDQDQATARIARTGQQNHVRVIYLVSNDPVDIAIKRSLARKSKNIISIVE